MQEKQALCLRLDGDNQLASHKSQKKMCKIENTFDMHRMCRKTKLSRKSRRSSVYPHVLALFRVNRAEKKT
ncbi:MAG TPA: hypothetical protein DCE42_23845 [Myxococcales bacterium]|nr:hypothetical protein [Deltaproteobacteria bacterium]MBU51383.1 hypothetical protein [Deltaproteobacteria bacterium]HAA57820.1 hypothetical protein [Myxococcales bacterium]